MIEELYFSSKIEILKRAWGDSKRQVSSWRRTEQSPCCLSQRFLVGESSVDPACQDFCGWYALILHDTCIPRSHTNLHGLPSDWTKPFDMLGASLTSDIPGHSSNHRRGHLRDALARAQHTRIFFCVALCGRFAGYRNRCHIVGCEELCANALWGGVKMMMLAKSVVKISVLCSLTGSPGFKSRKSHLHCTMMGFTSFSSFADHFASDFVA
jgi:hypothetical protein